MILGVSPRSVVALVSLCFAGCVVEPVDLTDKRCPCAAPATCDEATQRCVGGPDGCDPLVSVNDFSARWATAHDIWFDWTPVGEREDFVSYAIEIVADTPDFSNATVVDADANPELGGYVLPRTGGADNVVTHTAVRGLERSTLYHARLVVTDRSSCVYRSAPAAIRTTMEGPEPVPIYTGPRPPPPAFPIPDDLDVVDDGMGGECTEHRPLDDDECVMSEEGVCSQNIRWSGLEVDASDISEGELSELAYLEIVLTTDVNVPSFYSRFWLQTSGGGIYRVEPFTIPAGLERATLEVPVDQLVDGDRALDHATLQAETISEVNVGGQWSKCAADEAPDECMRGRVLLHSAIIRY